MKSKIQIKTVFGKILFELEKEDNTIKDTLEKAVKDKADLNGADLNRADLNRANLYGAKNIETARLPIYCKWGVSFIGNDIQIGCEKKSIPEWNKWFKSDKTFKTDRDTEDFKRIRAMFEAYKAYHKIMKGGE